MLALERRRPLFANVAKDGVSSSMLEDRRDKENSSAQMTDGGLEAARRPQELIY